MVAALVPSGLEGTGAGRLLGRALAALQVPNLAPTTSSGPEALLTAARAHVEAGNVAAAVKTLAEVEGAARLEVRDWVADASARLACDRAVANLADH
jgi:hypothetical protein